MRGADGYNESLFSTVRLEEFVPQTHPLRTIRTWLNEALSKMDAKFLQCKTQTSRAAARASRRRS
ncbi:hypothetical protein CG017_05191 [Burkholderia glumae]|nr:hypothetical protein KS03_5255 [Burkholderia glumae LMG 2196 = ATCC 33617]QKM57123.1 hypothetical protein CG017_05191 [Burkholderia glumae]